MTCDRKPELPKSPERRMIRGALAGSPYHKRHDILAPSLGPPVYGNVVSRTFRNLGLLSSALGRASHNSATGAVQSAEA